MVLTTCLWFDGNAREAAEFYCNIFPQSSVDANWNTPADTPSNDAGSEVVVGFTIFGSNFIGLNGGPAFRFNEAISFQIPCADQAEIDRYWEVLTGDGGEAGRCGWLKDKFGVSWQVVSPVMQQYLGGSDPVGAQAATEAMIAMSKIDLGQLKSAYEAASGS